MIRHYELKHWCMSALAAGVLTISSALSAEEPFDYFSNSWSLIGLKDYNDGTRMTPENELLLAKGEKLQLRFGHDLALLSRKQTKTLMDGYLPIVLLQATDGDVQYDFTFWATPLPTAKNWRTAMDWPIEGENYLNWVVVKATNHGSSALQGSWKAELVTPAKREVREVESATWSLAPGANAEAVLRIPFSAAVNDAWSGEDPRVWLARTVQFWRDLLAQGAQIQVPCPKATEALRAAHVLQLITNDHGDVHGGEGFYDEFYLRDGAYQVMQLEEAGMMEPARKAVDCFLRWQRPDGRFESQKTQWDANGQTIWTLWQYHKITGDVEWLRTVYPQMLHAAEWTKNARRQAPADSPFAGLLPNSLADGEDLWDGKYHIVGYDFWNLRGLLCAAKAAQALGETNAAGDLFNEAKLYREAIDAAWKKLQLPYFPPSWEKAGTHWGNTETLWPTEIFAADDPRVTASLDEVRTRHCGGFVEGTIRRDAPDAGKQTDAIHPYMSAYSTMASLVRGQDEQVVQDFYWYLLHSTAAHAFPEGIFYHRRFAWSDTIPHATGASNYAIMLRHMLVHEQDDELHLLPAVPDWWLGEGREISVQRAPTHFGVMNLVVRGTATGVAVELEPPHRQPPKRIMLHLPTSRPLTRPVTGVEIVSRADQKKRWDFPTVVAIYRQQADQAVNAKEPPSQK